MVDIHVYHHIEITHGAGIQLQAILDDMATKLNTLQKGIDNMTPELQALQQQVQRNNDTEESAIALLEGLAAQLQAAKEDPAAVQAIADSMSAESDRLAAAVVANTPASTTSPTPSGAGNQPTAAGGTSDAGMAGTGDAVAPGGASAGGGVSADGGTAPNTPATPAPATPPDMGGGTPTP